MKITFKQEFRWLNHWKKTVYLLYATADIEVDDGGLFKGAWSPQTGGGFGGVGIAQPIYEQDQVTGDMAEEYLSNQDKLPDMIGFSHSPGAMQTWPLDEVFKNIDLLAVKKANGEYLFK